MRLTVLVAALVACSGGSSAPPPAEPAPPAASTKPADAHADHGEAMMAQPPFQAASDAAKVSFVAPADGATVSSPVKLVFQADGVEIRKAGQLVAGTGHHHVIVDGEPVAAGQAVAADATHIHYGDGRTETELELTPGAHTLTMQLADGLHRSYGPGLSATIHVVVE